MKKNLFLLLLLVLVSVAACKKDDDKSRTEMLTGTWKMTASTVSPGIVIGGTTVTDIYAQNDACSKDDLMIFKSDKTFTFEEGATKCDDTDPQVIDSGTWTFNATETVISTNSTTWGIAEATIIELSDSKLVISSIYNDNGINYTYTDTYQKQ